ncbi:conserved oligomeric Golgi complex subunit 8 [Arctopsyche grandis]|uniref:conserved oligomeric Golgi complex subunit 8 n=1 Tax=Arctopsyche grandis TaxID=121162 RepID=UPI00406D8DA5
MDSKFGTILKIISPESSDEISEDDPEVCEYLLKLGNMTFEQILAEPAVLNDEMKALTEQTQELALTNYRTFVETAECSNKILEDFKKSKTALNELLEKIPKFTAECERLSSLSNDIMKERRIYDQIKDQNEQVLEIIELPNQMQAALNCADYEKAFDLFTHIHNLSQKYSDLAQIQNTSAEVTKLWFETLLHLFNQLRYDLPLPQCLQVLGYLRRANVVYESTVDEANTGLREYENNMHYKYNKLRNISDGLQLHFLKARGNWFDNTLTEAAYDENEKHLRKIVELHRIHLFNILTQHKAIFLSDIQGSKHKGDDLNGIAALSCWLKEKVDRLLSTLEKNVGQEDEASFEPLFNQCMYLCLSFGRVGADMRGVIAPLFRNIIANDFSKALYKADMHFESEMKSYKALNQSKIARKNLADSDQHQNSPPESILDFYPLGEYCNSILCAMNTLRVTAPLCLATKILNEISQSLKNVVRALVGYYNREQQGFSQAEREHLVLCCNLLTEELIPYFQKCFYQIFPPMSIADQLGVSAATLQDENLFTINVENISSPLVEILNSLK